MLDKSYSKALHSYTRVCIYMGPASRTHSFTHSTSRVQKRVAVLDFVVVFTLRLTGVVNCLHNLGVLGGDLIRDLGDQSLQRFNVSLPVLFQNDSNTLQHCTGI